jgi:nitrite reductase/ring-hydroxylating ferredoxin subunit
MPEHGGAPVAGGQVERITGDTLIARRDYLRILVTVSGGLVVGAATVAAGLFPKRTGSAEAVRIAGDIPAGAHVQFAYPSQDDRAIAMRLPDGTLVAYSSICTHLSCALLPRPQEAALVCPCHDGRFDARTGDVLEGPPPRPLPEIRLEQRGDGIYAVGAVPR